MVSDTVSILNFAANLTATSAGSGKIDISGSAGTSSTTFLSLTDTPAAYTANQFVRVDAAGNALEFGGSLGSASTNWDHASLPSGRLPSNNRRWYTYTGTSNVSRNLPLESGITSGWHSFIGNDSTVANVTMTGDFRGSVTQITLLPQQGCEISYNGSIFLEGPARQLITVSNFPEWDSNPLRRSTSYTDPDNGNRWSSGSSGVNVDNNNTRIHMLNSFVRYVDGEDYLFDIPTLSSSTFSETPIGSGFGVINQGSAVLSVRPRSDDELIRGSLTHNFSNPARLSTGASMTFVRLNTNQCNTTVQNGTITGGT